MMSSLVPTQSLQFLLFFLHSDIAHDFLKEKILQVPKGWFYQPIFCVFLIYMYIQCISFHKNNLRVMS